LRIWTEGELEPVRYDLREWGHFFRDRRRLERARSAEGNYRSPQRDHHEPIPGDPEPKVVDGPGFSLRRALRTDLIIRETFHVKPEEKGRPNLAFRALSYWYAFRVRPGPTGAPIYPYLRMLSRAAGYRIDQDGYAEIVLLSECKLLPALYKSEDSAYKPANVFTPAQAERPPRSGTASFPLHIAAPPRSAPVMQQRSTGVVVRTPPRFRRG